MSTPAVKGQQPDRNDPEHQTYTDAENKLSRQRSFALLGELVSPVKGQFAVIAIMVVIAQLAVVAGPAIIAWGIDHGLPSLMAGDPGPAYQAAGLAVGHLDTHQHTHQPSVHDHPHYPDSHHRHEH